MQTSLIRRTKGLANDQMRTMCAVIATALLLISNSHQHNPADTAEDNVVDYVVSETQNLLIKAEDYILTRTYDDKGITAPSEVGSDFLQIAGIEESVDDVSLRERQVSVETTENILTMERARAIEEEAIRKQLESITCDPTDISKISNMTKEQMEFMVEGTWLEGEADTLYRIENEYGINAFFIVSVSTLESDHGTSARSKDRSNYYGMETMIDYTTFENNTDEWADMMLRMYINKPNIGSDIHKIGPKYCPPNPKWASTVSGMMNARFQKVINHEYKKIGGLTPS